MSAPETVFKLAKLGDRITFRGPFGDPMTAVVTGFDLVNGTFLRVGDYKALIRQAEVIQIERAGTF